VEKSFSNVDIFICKLFDKKFFTYQQLIIILLIGIKKNKN